MKYKNLHNFRRSLCFKKYTDKDVQYIDFLKTRIAHNVPSDMGEMMLDFALSKDYHAKVLKDIEEDCFLGKEPSLDPVVHLVVSQTGGGKTFLSDSILKENKNIIFVESDSFKSYNPLAKHILEFCPTYYGFLTGLDAYLHRDEIYEKALIGKYNILTEIAPSSKDNFFNVDFDKLLQCGYKIKLHFLAVSLNNSLLSIHERYERQLNSGKVSKLTDLSRALDSYKAMEDCLQSVINNEDVEVLLYKRGVMCQNPVFLTNDKSKIMEAFYDALQEDEFITSQSLSERINNIQISMSKRNANTIEMNQFLKIKEIIQGKRKNA